jgi:hypothetical protein
MSCCNTCGSNVCSCVNGLNAFTTTSANFTQPAVASSVNVSLTNLGQLNGQWIGLGMVLYIVGGGYYSVTGVASLPATVGLTNLGYSGNAVAGTVVSSGAKVSPGGLIGVAGAPAVGGTTILFNDHTAQSQVNQGVSNLFQYSLPINTLSGNGDALEIEFFGKRTVKGSGANPCSLKLGFNGVAMVGQPSGLAVGTDTESTRFSALVTRLSATTVSVSWDKVLINDVTFANGWYHYYKYVSTLTLNNLGTNTNTIEVIGEVVNASPAQTVTAEYMIIKLLKS